MPDSRSFEKYDCRGAMEQLVNVVQELSLARDLQTVMAIVRRAAREITGADGATFVLRDGDLCHYAEENAIRPLWKGKRFPMSACISGWVMNHKTPALIEDIYSDDRIPAEVYRPTFVKSLVMVPIRRSDPIGAIGNYWAYAKKPEPEVVKILQALADTTSVAMENVQLYSELEQRVKDRTAQLEAANNELEAFSYTVSHDLRSPLRRIEGFTSQLAMRYSASLDDTGQDCIRRVFRSVERCRNTIDDLLTLSRTTRGILNRQPVNLASLAREIVSDLKENGSRGDVDFVAPENAGAVCDAGLLRVAMENLLGNALKFSNKAPAPRVEFGVSQSNGEKAFYVKDNGIGFDPEFADGLFEPFQRLHSDADYKGTGIGLATVYRIIMRHGGRIWAEATPGSGATFYFTLDTK
ncbi:MAG: ATP-binding protein [Syntrophobacteraceae bacterium]